MKSSGIYVELPIRASMDALWEYTQTPALHQQWDLRFTSIDYLPKQADARPQRFRYATRLGFGLEVAGEGETQGERHLPDGGATSALRFWSDNPLSIIRTGSGYWKCLPDGDTIRFLTWYDYETRFGSLGRLFDRLVFRPLISWATAWSFDALRLWLERGLRPDKSPLGLLASLGSAGRKRDRPWAGRCRRTSPMQEVQHDVHLSDQPGQGV